MQGSFNEVALSFETKDGENFPTLVNAAERKDADDRLLFIRLTVFNATDRRRYERELVKARETAETARRDLQALNQALEQRQSTMETSLQSVREESQLREQFIAVLGHDLRNPLAGISAAARMLERRGLDEEAAGIVRLMQGSVSRMAGLIDDIMDFAKARLGGGITLHRQDDGANLEAVLKQVVAELLSAAPDRVIESHIALDRPVSCDPHRIGQMVSNLLGNALTYGAEGKPIRLYASTAATAFELSVANEGAPIAAEAMDKLFQPFFRGEVQPSKQGLGLGLYIAFEIARAHGGRLTVASTPEETRFTFRMPLQ
jgi:sigma-B regulation protein RsbU (phosphoserine phosphatase)